MPRCARLDVQGGFYHLMARGNEKREIFLDEEDYRNFLRRLRKVLRESGDKCLAWCLMPNHFHLLFVRGALSHGGNSLKDDWTGDPRILGDTAFVEHVLGRPDPGLSLLPPSLERILERVCAESMFTPAEIKGPSRARNVTEARAKFCFLAKEAGIGGEVLSEELKRNSSAIAYLFAKGRKLFNN